ncbi:RagB/SusD family nutrient uptake outer membrane protein [Sphingobacterium luzhongxinii]|uniref:RagB/SusD family nutrient uptake outer membrane protein n=1 Tax=Sphingobacterium luzhongxinii TaxID=2654181 RepID=UPI0013D9AE17|nr:RagB/SusD family nutrient uptake outer membrane protein [Sphingobacterium sp. xlx-73]
MKNYVVYLFIAVLLILAGCTNFLDEKPRKGLVIPQKIEQLQSLLRKENESTQDPRYGEISTDDYYWNEADLNSKSEQIINCYKWKKENMFGQSPVIDWLYHYRFIYYTNTVLEKLPAIHPVGRDIAEWNKAKGEALFYRGKFLYDVAIIWASAYNTPDREKLLGIPVRLNTNFNEPSYRASLQDTYAQITKDIEESVSYLPEAAEHVTRPSKVAARAMAARIYLSMGRYEEALVHAEEVLKVKSELLDFKALSPTVSYPFSIFNKEVIFHSSFQMSMNNIFLNPDLLHSYDNADLRKSLYFVFQNNGKVNFKGSYVGRSALFCGLAVDEMYLIAAECRLRSGDLDKAKSYMEYLLQHRFSSGEAPSVVHFSSEQLLDFILAERRKELVFRGLRWSDIKRLNNEGRNIRLVRPGGGASVYLEPNDPRFNLPFPEGLLNLSEILQNIR